MTCVVQIFTIPSKWCVSVLLFEINNKKCYEYKEYGYSQTCPDVMYSISPGKKILFDKSA